MIHVRLQWRAGLLQGFHVSGHAGYAPHGRDIVCAAVSALAQTAVIGLQEVVGVAPDVERDDEAGLLACRLPAALSERQAPGSQVILQTFAAGVRAVERAHPRHVRVSDVHEDAPLRAADS